LNQKICDTCSIGSPFVYILTDHFVLRAHSRNQIRGSTSPTGCATRENLKIWVVTLAIALKKKLSESIAKELILLPIMSIMIDLFGLMHDAMLRRLVRRLFL